jgi:PKD repeat protein
VRRGLALALALVTLAPAAAAAPAANVTIQASPTDGAAPLTVTFTAGGDAASYHWDLGDGTVADGKTVQHVYRAGRWTATLTAQLADGETATQTVAITARGVALNAPSHVRYSRRATFRGAVVPAEGGKPITLEGGPRTRRATRTKANGTFAVTVRLYRPQTFVARSDVAASAPVPVSIVPRLRTRLIGSGARGTRLVFAASIRPRDAGDLAITIARGGRPIVDNTFHPPARFKLDTQRLTTYRIRVSVHPREGFTGAVHALRAAVVLPRLGYSAHGATVVQLAQRLRQLHYAAPFTSVFDTRVLDAVYAFQKVQDLPRTGVVDAALWRRLSSPRVPAPRYRDPASHIEIDKAHQVLYVVRGSRIALIVPVSTAGIPGYFTPVGRFAIYRKVTGFDSSPLGTLYDPMYFTGGYAIHGNPSVPPYPASHGCVRVPMWLAPQLYATNPYGETVYVF